MQHLVNYIHPLAGYMTAWSNWFQWVIVGMSEIIAVGLYMQYWFPEFQLGYQV